MSIGPHSNTNDEHFQRLLRLIMLAYNLSRL